MAKKRSSRAAAQPSEAALRRELQRAELELSLTEAKYTAGLMQQLMGAEQRLSEAQMVMAEPEDRGWDPISSGSSLSPSKPMLGESRDSQTLRRQMYRFWRYHAHGRGILRNFVRFIIGTGFSLDFDDIDRGNWTDSKKTAVKITTKDDDPVLANLIWSDFVKRNVFKQRAKEIILRVFRDGEMFLRKFERAGRITVRFVEPERVSNGMQTNLVGTVQAGDLEDDSQVGEPTRVMQGIEFLQDDIETVVAYHTQVMVPGQGTVMKQERIPAKDMIHVKALCDMNDLRGIPMLEVVAKKLVNYDQWEEYRLILNKMRTAVALVRKVTGTSSQAEAIIANRMSPRQQPQRLEPVTGSGRREAMFRPGTTLTPSPGVEYDFISPNLQARDAAEDGRRFLMSIAAGVGLPEMLVTGDWSNGNFASAVTAQTPAVREWEDWQEFFEPCFQKVYEWVIEAAVAGLGAPEDMSREVTIQWPPLIAKDAFRETERLMNLWASGVLSKQTWSAQEDLNFDDEQENLHDEAVMEAENPVPVHQVDVATLPTRPKEGQNAGPLPSPKTGKNPYVADIRSTIATATEAKDAFRESLALLEADLDGVADPALRGSLERYMATANRVLAFTGRPGSTHAPRPAHRRARARR